MFNVNYRRMKKFDKLKRNKKIFKIPRKEEGGGLAANVTVEIDLDKD